LLHLVGLISPHAIIGKGDDTRSQQTCRRRAMLIRWLWGVDRGRYKLLLPLHITRESELPGTDSFDCQRFSIYKLCKRKKFLISPTMQLISPSLLFTGTWSPSVTLKRVKAWNSLLTPSIAEMQNHDWGILGHSVALCSYARTNKMAITRTMYLGPFRANAVTMFSPLRFLSPRPLNSSLLIKFLRHEFLSWPNLLSLHS